MTTMRSPWDAGGGRPARLLGWCAVVAIGLMAAGCSPWRVVQRSGPPSALKGAKAVSVAYDDSGMTVHGIWGWSPIQVYRGKMNETQRKKFEDVVANANKSLFAGLHAGLPGVKTSQATGKAAADEVRVTFKHLRLRQGKFAVVFAVPTEMNVQAVWSVGDRVVDIIQVATSVESTITTPSIHQRVSMASRRLGGWTANFFNKIQQGK